MNNDLLHGKLVRLTANEPENMSQAFARWSRDTEYHRLLNFDPAYTWSAKKWKEWLEKNLDKPSQTDFFFAIHNTEDERLIGFIGLADIEWQHGTAWVVIALGDRKDWGKGYGSEAMGLILEYAFTELNLYRVNLGVFEYNPRALRSYEKNGFILEGRQRQAVERAGQRWDVLIMGILQTDWLRERATRET